MKATNFKALRADSRVFACLLLFGGVLVAYGGQAQSRTIGLLEKATAGKFLPGHYTTLDGQRHAGSIRIWHDEQRNLLQVDQGKKTTPLNIAPAELKSVVIGSDSIIVVRRFQHLDLKEPLLSEQPDFCRVRLSGKVQVLEHERLYIGRGKPMQGANGMMYGGGSTKELIASWLLRMPTDTTLYVVPSSSAAFGPATARLFVDNPALCQQLTAGYVGYNDFNRIIYAYLFKREIGQVSYEEANNIFR